MSRPVGLVNLQTKAPASVNSGGVATTERPGDRMSDSTPSRTAETIPVDGCTLDPLFERSERSEFESFGHLMARYLKVLSSKVDAGTDAQRHEDYQAYLQSGTWHAKRQPILKRAAGRCERCHTANVRLEVHHMVYRGRGHERDDDLVALCPSCHAEVHKDEG